MQVLLDELKRRQDAGNPVTFWLRDDDAVEPSAALSRFSALTEAYSIPATLAVIPENTGEALAENLRHMSHIDIAVHGWSHKNHAPETEKKQELGIHRPCEQVLVELSQGFNTLSTLYADRFVPLLVPPWNRIAHELIDSLSDIGFTGLSTFGHEKPEAIKMINTHVDLIDWKGTRGGRSSDLLVGEFIENICATQKPIGFLTHHLVHDEAAWSFMENLFEATARHKGCRWVSSREILNRGLPDPGFPAQ
jgi:peptidoglycan/xylan/chitin deacetylase (PgdA/CDA1 family)